MKQHQGQLYQFRFFIRGWASADKRRGSIFRDFCGRL